MKNTLVLCFITMALCIISCRKEQKSTNPADKMNGMHKWHGGYSNSQNLPGTPGTSFHRVINDTPISIEVFDSAVIFGGRFMPLESINAANHTMLYLVHYSIASASLTYDYVGDSISYVYSYLTHYSSEYTTLKTP